MPGMSWEYLAGFFDGEGHIGLGRQKHCGEGRFSRGAPRVTLVQAHERGRLLLEEIKAFLQAHNILSVVEIHQQASKRISLSFRLRITGFNGCERFLEGVFPYLRIKKVEAQDLLRYSIAFPSLKGKGHSHSDNVKKSWITRRERYPNGYRNSDSPRIHGKKGLVARWQ